MTLPPESPLLTIEQAAAYLSVPTSTIYRWRTKGLPSPRAVRLGKSIRFLKQDLDAFIAQSRRMD